MYHGSEELQAQTLVVGVEGRGVVLLTEVETGLEVGAVLVDVTEVSVCREVVVVVETLGKNKYIF